MRGAMIVAALVAGLTGAAAALASRPAADSRSVLCFSDVRESGTVEFDLDGGFTRGPVDVRYQIHGQKCDSPLSSFGPFTPTRTRRARGDVVTYRGERRGSVTFIVRARFVGTELVRFGARYRPARGTLDTFPRRVRLSDVRAVEIGPAE